MNVKCKFKNYFFWEIAFASFITLFLAIGSAQDKLSTDFQPIQHSFQLVVKEIQQLKIEEAENPWPAFSGISGVDVKKIIAASLASIDLQFVEGAFLDLGNHTMLRTQNSWGAPIQLSVVGSLQFAKSYSLKKMIHLLMHEVGHQVVGHYFNQNLRSKFEIEALAWKFADLYTPKLIELLPNNYLLNLRLGSYRGARKGCQDSLKIETIDFRQAQIGINVTSSQGRCRSLEGDDRFNQFKFKMSCQGQGSDFACTNIDKSNQNLNCDNVSKKDLDPGALVVGEDQIISYSNEWCLQGDYRWTRSHPYENTFFIGDSN